MRRPCDALVRALAGRTLQIFPKLVVSGDEVRLVAFRLG